MHQAYTLEYWGRAIMHRLDLAFDAPSSHYAIHAMSSYLQNEVEQSTLSYGKSNEDVKRNMLVSIIDAKPSHSDDLEHEHRLVMIEYLMYKYIESRISILANDPTTEIYRIHE
jgi:hypothetical protein